MALIIRAVILIQVLLLLVNVGATAVSRHHDAVDTASAASISSRSKAHRHLEHFRKRVARAHHRRGHAHAGEEVTAGGNIAMKDFHHKKQHQAAHQHLSLQKEEKEERKVLRAKQEKVLAQVLGSESGTRIGYPISSPSECRTESPSETHCVVVTFDTAEQAGKFVELSGQCSGAGCTNTAIADQGSNCLCWHRWLSFIQSNAESKQFAQGANADLSKCNDKAKLITDALR